jgi:hypothetical protein
MSLLLRRVQEVFNEVHDVCASVHIILRAGSATGRYAMLEGLPHPLYLFQNA